MAAGKKKLWKMSASSGYITNLKQSILETFDIYGLEHRQLEGDKQAKINIKFGILVTRLRRLTRLG
jgi:hypothetical protein